MITRASLRNAWPNSALLRAFLGLVVSAYAAVVAWSSWLKQPVTLDDAFISYRYADMLVQGKGLVYNVGERVEGYTNFLWTLFAAAGIALGGDPLNVTRTIGLISLCLCIAVCAAIVTHGTDEPKWRDALLLLGLVLLALPKGLVQAAGTGLETMFVGFMVLALGAFNHLWVSHTVPGVLFRAGLAVVLLLTRLDAAPEVAASAAVLLYQERQRCGQWRGALWSVWRWAALVGAALGIYLAWKVSYYGDIVPNTYYAKGGNLVSIEPGRLYVEGFLRSAPYVLVLIPLGLVALFATRRRRYHALAVFLACVVVVRLLYLTKIGGDFMEYRFMWQSYPVLVAVALIGALELVRRVGVLVPFFSICAGLTLIRSPVVLETKYHMQAAAEMNGFAQMGMLIGKRFREVMPREAILSTTLAGTIAYYGKYFTVIDQWGLNDKYIGKLPIKDLPLNGRGHLKGAPESYLHERGVNLYIHHPAICDCRRPCKENKPNVFVRLEADLCLRTWYFTQTQSLTEYFCNHPDDFLVYGIRCPRPARGTAKQAPRK